MFTLTATLEIFLISLILEVGGIGSCCAAQVGLELILLPQPPKWLILIFKDSECQ